MKKIFVILFAALLIVSGVCAQNNEPESYEITERAYILDGTDDLPEP